CGEYAGIIWIPNSRRARPTWGQAMWVHFAAHLGSEPEMAAAVAIQGAKHALPRDHCLQPRHHRQRGFFFHQLRVIDLAGGIVENHQQVVPALVLEPAMPAAIDVQQHPRQRTAMAPLAMHSPLALPRHPSRSRPRQLDPRLTHTDSVLLHQLLVKVQHIEIEVLLAIQLMNQLSPCHRYTMLSSLL